MEKGDLEIDESRRRDLRKESENPTDILAYKKKEDLRKKEGGRGGEGGGNGGRESEEKEEEKEKRERAHVRYG